MENRDKKLAPAERLKIEAIEQFEFLVQLHEFTGPEIGERWVAYQSSGLGVRIFYDNLEHDVETTLLRPNDHGELRAGLSCLYVSAKLGPAQKIKSSGRSSREVAASIAAQAEALRVLLPVVLGPAGPDLIAGCHGR